MEVQHVIIGLDDGPDHMFLDYQERQAQAAQKQALSEISEDALRIAEDHFRPLRLLGNQLDQAPDDVDVVLFDVIHSLASQPAAEVFDHTPAKPKLEPAAEAFDHTPAKKPKLEPDRLKMEARSDWSRN